jgi:PIN like domain
MKNKFKGYYRITEKKIKAIWDSGFISIDANVLLNLYRYSDDTRNELLLKVEKYADQLWLTYHAAYEFHKNRIGVISDQIKVYEDTLKEFDKLEDSIINNSKSPNLSKPVEKTFKKSITTIKKDLEKRKTFYLKLLTNDTILNNVTRLFSSKIGDQLSKEEISKIEKDGEERYKKNIPPGYKDKDKQDNKFGDLIIWKELIKKAHNETRPFIFIVDDMKEDWWLMAKGFTLSPRSELSQELYLESGQSFYMYSADRFLEHASKGKAVTKEAIKEVKNVQKTIYSKSIGGFPINESQFMLDPLNLYSQSNQDFFLTQPATIYGPHGIYSSPGTIYTKPFESFTQPTQLVTQMPNTGLVIQNSDENETK